MSKAAREKQQQQRVCHEAQSIAVTQNVKSSRANHSHLGVLKSWIIYTLEFLNEKFADKTQKMQLKMCQLVK